MTQPAKHTPGPWSTFGPVKYQVYGGDPVRRIAVVDYTTGSETEEHNANAHLIAAAPAMYALIKDMRQAFYVDGKRKALLAVMERSHDVVAQAEGRQPQP